MSATEAYLIIDIGTGNARVAVAAADGTILSIEREDVQYQKDERYPDSIYFDTDTLWQQILRLADAALDRTKNITITAITATSQREGIVLIGPDGESLIGLPNIDHRGREWEDAIPKKNHIYQLTGRYPTSLFSVFKLLGVRHRRPDLWNKTSTFLSISDWIQHKLSGVARYEHSQASETLLYDVAKGQWSDELCILFDIDKKLLPPLQPSATLLSPILPEYRTRWPQAANASIVVGGSDTQLAIESIKPSTGDLVIVSGTTTPIIRMTDQYIVDSRQRTWTSRHTDQHRFVLEANAGVTGLNYQRLKAIFYPNEGYDVIETELSELLEHSANSCSQCVASLGSLVADEQSPITRGGFIFNVPVSHQLTRASFVWATLWDIACSIKENYLTLCDVTPHDKDYIWACGGGMQSRTLLQLIAGLLGKKVKILDNFRHSSVIGGVSCCQRALTGAEQPPATPDIVHPQNENFTTLYQEWKDTRTALKKLI